MTTETMAPQNEYLQELLDRGERIPPGEYWVDTTPFRNLLIGGRSGLTVDLSGVILKALPSNLSSYTLLTITDSRQITILGGTFVGDRDSHIGTTGEWGMGISIRGSTDITLKGTVVKDCWGDGIYVADDALSNPALRLTLDGVTCQHNRRNGLTITYAHGVTAEGCVFKDNGGVSPGCGVDIEPNARQHVSDVVFDTCFFEGNTLTGLTISRPVKNAETASVRHVTVLGCEFHDNPVGLKVSEAKHVSVAGARVAGNILGMFVTGSRYVQVAVSDFSANGTAESSSSWAIRAKNSRALVVRNTTIRDGYGVGIGTTGCTGELSGNTIRHMQRTTNRNDAGISLSGWVGPVVANVVDSNSGWGLVLDSGSTFEQYFKDNIFSENLLGSIKQVTA